MSSLVIIYHNLSIFTRACGFTLRSWEKTRSCVSTNSWVQNVGAKASSGGTATARLGHPASVLTKDQINSR